MTSCASKAVQDLYRAGLVDGIVSAGGSNGTALAAGVMRDVLPVGLPKLIVSTMASGDTRPVVGETDITLMHSVVDVAGLNPILRDVLSNAGAAIANMALSHAARRAKKMEDTAVESTKKWRVGITMFGVTTPGVDAIRSISNPAILSKRMFFMRLALEAGQWSDSSAKASLTRSLILRQLKSVIIWVAEFSRLEEDDWMLPLRPACPTLCLWVLLI